MVRLLILILLVNILLLAVALIDCLSTDREEIRTFPKFVWALIILVFPVVGPGLWFTSGRPTPPLSSGGGSGPDRQRGRSRPVAPDDDPEFLRNLAASTRQSDEARLRAWEDDLHRREERLRHEREENPPKDSSTPPEESAS